MKRFFAALLLLAALGRMLPAKAEQNAYPDGIYRGFYYDGGIEQIAIQFELKNGVFDSLVFRGVKYKDGDYLSEDASDAQKAILKQYRQMADHLIGKDVSAIDDLYTPYAFVEDADAVTTATIQSSKLISALWDGLNRRPFKLVNTSKLPAAQPYADGVYRGAYREDGGEQVALEFSLQDSRFISIQYRTLSYGGQDYLSPDAPLWAKQIAGQFEQLTAYLVGKEVACVNDLYLPGNIVADTDVASGATIRAPKVISAIWDGLNRHAYRIQ